jgi:hypothetical protein
MKNFIFTIIGERRRLRALRSRCALASARRLARLREHAWRQRARARARDRARPEPESEPESGPEAEPEPESESGPDPVLRFSTLAEIAEAAEAEDLDRDLNLALRNLRI